MDIDQVTLTTDDPDAGATFYRDVLGLPVSRGGDGVEVGVGRSALVLRNGVAVPTGRAHHLAFDVPDARFDAALDWVAGRASVITKDGTTVIAGPPGWNSRSVYFWGPDGAVLELIARADLAVPAPGAEATGAFDPDEILHISEVAVGVSGALAVARALTDTAGLEPFTPVTDEFLPVGDQHGLLILTDVERTLLPTASTRIALAPVEVTVRGPREATVHPTEQSVVVAARTAGE